MRQLGLQAFRTLLHLTKSSGRLYWQSTMSGQVTERTNCGAVCPRVGTCLTVAMQSSSTKNYQVGPRDPFVVLCVLYVP